MAFVPHAGRQRSAQDAYRFVGTQLLADRAALPVRGEQMGECRLQQEEKGDDRSPVLSAMKLSPKSRNVPRTFRILVTPTGIEPVFQP